MGNKGGESLSFLLLGEIYLELKNYRQTRICAIAAMKWAKEKGIREILVKGNLLLSKLYYVKENISESLKYFKEGEKNLGNLTDPELLWEIDYQRGQIYQRQGKLNEALDCYKKCLEVFKKICANITDKELQESYLNAPNRKRVFTAIEEIERKIRNV